MDWLPQHTSLRNTLAALFLDRLETRSLLEEAGIPVIHVALGDGPIGNWHEVVKQALQRGKLQALLEAALARYPDHPVLRSFTNGTFVAPPEVSLDWRGSASEEPTLEKVTGLRPTFLPISFLARGLDASRSVGRVLLPTKAGTGFLIPGALLVTNHHVIQDEAEARSAEVQFNYQQTVDGANALVDSFDLVPGDGFATSKEDDWTVVRVKAKLSQSVNEMWGALALVNSSVSVNDAASIIQHPEGGPKQIAIYHNYVAFVDETRLQYLTDTLPGSSGSPVFNDRWEVVAIHHAGGYLTEPGNKRVFLRNEGIRSSVVRGGLARYGLSPP